MTGGKFYEKLAETNKRMVWKKEDGLIRGMFRHSKNKRRFCPITAVYYLQNGCKNFVHVSHAYDAASVLKLNSSFAGSIMEAADDRGSEKVRRHILRTVGVK